jgi:hypothetical protein
VIPLPDAGDGSRRNRAKKRRPPRAPRGGDRQSTGQLVAVGVALVLALAAIGYVAIGLVTGDDDSQSGSGTDTQPTGGGSASSSSLVVVTGEDGIVAGITVLAVSSSGSGGSVVHVPPGAMVEVPSFGLTSLADAAAEGSGDLLRTSIENLLGITFDAAVALDPEAVARLVPAAGLDVSLEDAVEEQTSTGRIGVVFPAGAQTLGPRDTARFLAALGDGTQLQRLVRHQAFWTAYLEALDASPSPAEVLGPDVGRAVTALAAGPVRHQVLPVESVGGTTGADELYRVPGDELVALVRRLFPDAIPSTTSGERIRVQVLNGVGTPGLAQLVSPLLVPAGAQVTLSDNADRFDYAVTQVVYYDDARQADAEAVRAALGVGELVKSLADLDVVDVTVVIGADFVQAHAGSNPTPSPEGPTP